MNNRDHSKHQAQPRRSFWLSHTGMVVMGFLSIAAVLLIFEHRIHILTETGILIILLSVCIGMHLFMHRKHGNPDIGDARKDHSDHGDQR